MLSRERYVAMRIGTRMAARGEAMTLRRTTLSSGPVPYRNPPDTSDDITVTAGAIVDGQAFLAIAGSSIIGRLVAGDQILCSATPGGPTLVTWTVRVMPLSVQTDADGVVVVDNAGVPMSGPALHYTPDALASADGWPAIPVSAPGDPDPALSVGSALRMSFAADQVVYGTPLSFERMTAMGWTETDTIGVRLAAYNNGPILPPKIDDLLFIGGKIRAILTIGQAFSNGIQFTYTVQAR